MDRDPTPGGPGFGRKIKHVRWLRSACMSRKVGAVNRSMVFQVVGMAGEMGGQEGLDAISRREVAAFQRDEAEVAARSTGPGAPGGVRDDFAEVDREPGDGLAVFGLLDDGLLDTREGA